MKRISFKSVCFSIFSALLLFGLTLNAHGFEISIDIAPNVLNIESQGEVVTVHTDVAYWTVDVYSVYLNGVLINSWKADNRGNFVAKFLMNEIKTLEGLIIGDYNTLQLVGMLNENAETFAGEAEIKVVDNDPKGSRH